MNRTAASVVTLIVVTCIARLAAGAEIKGYIKLAPDFTIAPLFDAPGYWQLPNDVMEVQPPLVDPRTEMAVELNGAGLPARELVKPEIRIEDSRFTPVVLVVKPGTRFTITNRDWMGHLLDTEGLRAKRLGLKDSLQHSFAKPGTYHIRCTEVPHLVAEVFVSDAPMVTLPDSTGVFRFPDIAAGSYTLRIWYRGKLAYSEPVAAKGTIRVDIQLKSPAKKD